MAARPAGRGSMPQESSQCTPLRSTSRFPAHAGRVSSLRHLHPWRPPALLQEGALGPKPMSPLLHEPPGPPWPSLREHARATSGGSSGESWEIIYAFCDCFPLAPYPSRLCQLWQTSARPYWDTMKADGTIASRAISASDLSKSDGPIMLQLWPGWHHHPNPALTSHLQL